MRFGYLLHNNNHGDWERHQRTDRSTPPAVADAAQLANDLRLMEMAVDYGFDTVWTSEHHFSPYLMVPNTIQLLTYVAGRCARRRRGHRGGGAALARADPGGRRADHARHPARRAPAVHRPGPGCWGGGVRGHAGAHGGVPRAVRRGRADHQNGAEPRGGRIRRRALPDPPGQHPPPAAVHRSGRPAVQRLDVARGPCSWRPRPGWPRCSPSSASPTSMSASGRPTTGCAPRPGTSRCGPRRSASSRSPTASRRPTSTWPGSWATPTTSNGTTGGPTPRSTSRSAATTTTPTAAS